MPRHNRHRELALLNRVLAPLTSYYHQFSRPRRRLETVVAVIEELARRRADLLAEILAAETEDKTPPASA